MGDWSLGNFIIFIIIFIIVLIIIVYNISNLDFLVLGTDEKKDSNNKTDITEVTTTGTYGELETVVVNATKQYMTKYYPNLLEGDKFVIKITSLVSEGYMKTPVDPKHKRVTCTGYATVYKDAVINYQPYIKCGDNYTTTGYMERYE